MRTASRNRSQTLRHLLVAGGQAGVGRDDPGDPVGVLGGQAQADQPAPVLADHRDVGQVERVERERAHPLHVPRVRVVARSAGLSERPKPTRSGAIDP